MNTYSYIGQGGNIHTLSGVVVAHSFTRIVHGGRGAYVEFNSINVLHIPDDQRWRVYSKKSFYIEYRTLDNIKVYHQLKEVDYADYKVGMFYISPVFLKEFEKTGETYAKNS
jgi:hypothetical protein